MSTEEESKEQIELETKRLERDKIALEIAKLNKSPFKEPAIWVGLVTTVLTLILTGVINFEPLKRQIEISKLRNELEQIKLEKKSYELEERKNKFEQDSLLLSKGLDSLNTSVVLLNSSISRKQDSLSGLKNQITGYNDKIIELNNSKIIEQFSGSLNGVAKYSTLVNNYDFANSVKLFNRHSICKSFIDSKLKNLNITIGDEILLLCVKYNDNLLVLDTKLRDIVIREDNKKNSSLTAGLFLAVSLFEKREKIPVFCEEILREFFSGNEIIFSDYYFFNLLESKGNESMSGIIYRKWFKRKSDGTIDKVSMFNNSQTTQIMNKYIYTRIMKRFSEVEKVNRLNTSASRKVVDIQYLLEECKTIGLVNLELSLYYIAKIRILIGEIEKVDGYGSIEQKMKIETYKTIINSKTLFGRLINSDYPSFPKSDSDINDFKKWLDTYSLNSDTYSVDTL